MQSNNAADRIRTILRGAFAGSPTPLKDIPKKNGTSRRSGSQRAKPRKKLSSNKSG
jgi:hypothetical protein